MKSEAKLQVTGDAMFQLWYLASRSLRHVISFDPSAQFPIFKILLQRSRTIGPAYPLLVAKVNESSWWKNPIQTVLDMWTSCVISHTGEPTVGETCKSNISTSYGRGLGYSQKETLAAVMLSFLKDSNSNSCDADF